MPWPDRASPLQAVFCEPLPGLVRDGKSVEAELIAFAVPNADTDARAPIVASCARWLSQRAQRARP